MRKPSFISNNIEKLLILAATDDDFRNLLLQDRKSVIENPEFSLNKNDKIILANISLSRLSNMIELFLVQSISRRNFLKGTAASLAIISGGSLLSSSLTSAAEKQNYPYEPHTEGCRPDYPPFSSTPVSVPPVSTEKVSFQGAEIVHEFSGLKLVIPYKALDKSVKVSIEIIAPAEVNNGFIHMDVYKFSPVDTVFKKDILIYFPTVKYKGAYVYRLKKIIKESIFTPLVPDDTVGNIADELKAIPDKSIWEKLTADTSQKGYIVLKTKNFGIYTAGYFR